MKIRTRNRYYFWVCLMVILLLAYALFVHFDIFGLNRNSQTVDFKKDPKGNYSEELLDFRSRNINEQGKINELLSDLKYGEYINKIYIKKDKVSNKIYIDYSYKENEMKNIYFAIRNNALILFSLIKNIKSVKVNLVNENRCEFEFNRSEMQNYFKNDLWSYSLGSEVFKKFTKSISILIFTQTNFYALANSNGPGLDVDCKINADVYGDDNTIEYSVEKGYIQIFKSGKFSERTKIITNPPYAVYWTPNSNSKTKDFDIITISVFDKSGSKIFEKQLQIIKDGEECRVNPTYDVLVDTTLNLN